MLAVYAWSLLSKLLLRSTQEGHISLHITPTGDLVIKPADSALRVSSGTVRGCCLHNGVVLFKVNGTPTRLCEWSTPVLPFKVVCPRTDTELYETSDAWAEQYASIMDSLAVPCISPFEHALTHVASLSAEDVDAHSLCLLLQVFPSLSRLVTSEGTWCGCVPAVVECSDAVTRVLQAEMASCDDELLCVALQAIGRRFGCTLTIPAAAVETTNMVVDAMESVLQYKQPSFPLPVAKFRAYVGAHNFDVTQSSIAAEKDADKQYQMRLCARERGGIQYDCAAASTEFSMCVEGQSTVEAQPGDCVCIDGVALGQTIQVWDDRGACRKCMLGPCGEFTPEAEGMYSVNGRQLSVAYNTAKIGSWRMDANDTFSRVCVKPGDVGMSDAAATAMQWRFCNDVYAMFADVRVELHSVELGVYAVRAFPAAIWHHVCMSDTGTTMRVVVHYGRLSTVPACVDISGALRASARPAGVADTVFGSFADLFPHIEPHHLRRAAVVCTHKLWTQPDVALSETPVSACGETTAAWLMSECEVSVDTCTFIVPGTMEAIRENREALPCISIETTESVCQLVGRVSIHLPQFNCVHVSETSTVHDLGGTTLRWADGFTAVVLHCGLHLCSSAARHEQLILTNTTVPVVQVQVTDPTPTNLVCLNSVGCFAWIVGHTVYVYNVGPGRGDVWIVEGIRSEPTHVSTLSLEPYPYFTHSPASLPLQGEMHEICSVWGTGFRGCDLLSDKLTGLVPPFTPAASRVLDPNCNTRSPCGLVALPVQHTLHSSVFQAFGYNPDQYIPWTVASAYESVWRGSSMQSVLRKALCGCSASLLQCMNLQLTNPYPDAVLMQMRVPTSVLISHESDWVAVNLKGCVDGSDVVIKGACVTRDGALYVALTGLSSEYNNSVLLQEIPTSMTVPAAVLLVLRCFLQDAPMSITLPATLQQKRTQAIAATFTHLDYGSDD